MMIGLLTVGTFSAHAKVTSLSQMPQQLKKQMEVKKNAMGIKSTGKSVLDGIIANPSPHTPLRQAKVRVRIINVNLGSDPNHIEFFQRDVCILESDKLNVYDHRPGAPVSSESSPNLGCVDSLSGATIGVWVSLRLENTKTIDQLEDVKVASAAVYASLVSNGVVSNISSASNFVATRDLNQKGFLLSVAPDNTVCTTSSDGSTVTCKPKTNEYYSAIVDIED